MTRTTFYQLAQEGFSEQKFLLTYEWYMELTFVASQVNFCGKSSILGGEITKVPSSSLSSAKTKVQ